MVYWYYIKTGGTSIANNHALYNAFHVKMNDADGFSTYNKELYIGYNGNGVTTINTYFVTTSGTTSYGTYVKYSKTNGHCLNGYPLVVKSLNEINHSYMIPIEGDVISGSYVIPDHTTTVTLSSMEVDRGMIPVHIDLKGHTYNYMLLDYEVNGAWVQTRYTRADNNIKSIYLCNITDANTPGSSYPTDIISLYNNSVFNSELVGEILDFGKETQDIPKTISDFIKANFKEYDDGSLDMNLYHNNAERNRVDKTNFLESVSTLNGYLRDKTSITNPSIIIEMSEFPTFNYVYLPKFNRYYYVTNILSIATNLWQIDMHVDVLMSYKDKILLQSAIIERNEYEWDPYLIDSSLPVSKEPNITVEEVPQSIINTTYGDDDMYTFFLEVVG